MDNAELSLAYNYAQYTHRNIFLTGKAGTGKTTFLRRLRQESQKRMIVVAPTGVAAINAGGVTIHSFFQLAPGMFLPGQNINGRESKTKYSFSKKKVNILRSLDLLVIDEISMVRCDLLDAIDEVLRRYQHRYLPFGGVQLLMIGDLQQLAPVAKEDEWQILQQHGYTSPYFFGSKALNKAPYVTIELKKVYRQADPTFINLLNEVRDNRMSQASLNTLNSRVRPNFRPDDKEGYITLTTHNHQAQDINQMKLMMLPTQPMTYLAHVSGDFPESSYPTDKELVLKIGAQVMFCKNDPNHAYYNGKIGRVAKCDNDRVWVECQPDSMDPNNPEEKRMIEVVPQEWTNAKYSTNQKTGEITEEIVGQFSQMPLKTAWAITIHKSQGLTFDRAIIQAELAFSPGQVYVALSRCRSLEGLVLNAPIPPGVIMVDQQVMAYNKLMEENQPTEERLSMDRRQCIEEVLCRIFDFSGLFLRVKYITEQCEQHLYRVYPMYVQKLKMLRDEIEGVTEAQKRQSLVGVGNSFKVYIHQQIGQTESFEANTALQERLVKGFAWFLNRTSELLQDLVEDDLPEIDNQALKEQLIKEFDLLAIDYNLKIQIFTKCLNGFSLDAYWEAKAIATMNEEEDSAKGKKAKAAAKTGKKGGSAGKSEIVTSTGNLEKADIQNEALYEALRKWRIEKATQGNVPAYVILPNTAMIGIANTMPSTSKEFLAIKGFGKAKLTAFGQELLEIIDKFR